MAISTSAIPALLLPGVRKIKGIYEDYEKVWPHLFATSTSEMQVERTESMRYLPLAQLKQTGAPTIFDNGAGQRFTYNHIHVAIGLGYSFTREAIDDNLYKTQFDPTNLGLVKSFNQTKEILGAGVFNTGNVVNSSIGGDGVALFATNHPVDGYTVPNTPTVQVALNENTLLMAGNQIMAFRDNAGLLIAAQPRLLVVPTALRHVAQRLLETPLRTGTSNNDESVVKNNGDYRDGYKVNPYFTSNYAWFCLTDQGGFIHLQRVPFESSMQVEFTTDNLLVKGYERYYMGYDDWRAGYGVFPSN